MARKAAKSAPLKNLLFVGVIATVMAVVAPTLTSTTGEPTLVDSMLEQFKGETSAATQTVTDPALDPTLTQANHANLNVGPEWVRDSSYNRDDFGPAWADTDRNGCDTRNDVLSRDLTNSTEKNCVIQTGTLESDLFTQQPIQFVRGQGACTRTEDTRHPVIYNPATEGGCSNALQIDHIVSLEELHYAGATAKLNPEELQQLANDPLNLVTTGVNSWKSSKTPAEILNDTNNPMTQAGMCNYANRYTQVMTKYDLNVRPTDADAISTILTGCAI